jgi:GntR family transcriptional regulator, histidine utilization repressor
MNWQTTLKLDGSGPLYEQIKRAIIRPIRQSVWKPGDRIPPEHDLLRHFSASRMTINRALRELAEEGYVTRHRRMGSFVASPPAPTAILDIVDMATVIPKRGQHYRYERISRDNIKPDPDLAARLGIGPNDDVCRVIGRHFADGEIVELEERWINLSAVPEAATLPFDEISPNHWLVSHVPWTEAEHTITAINADAGLASALGCPAGTACLLLERRTFRDDQVVTFARLTHPGSRHRLTERFKPGSGGR